MERVLTCHVLMDFAWVEIRKAAKSGDKEKVEKAKAEFRKAYELLRKVKLENT